MITNAQELQQAGALTPSFIDDLPIDVVEQEVVTFGYVVTDYATENGSNVTSARYRKPVIVLLDCIFTSQDLSPANSARQLLNGTFSFDTWQDKKKRLYEIKDSNAPIVAGTELDTYEDMVIQDLVITRDYRKSRALFCRILLKHVSLVSLGTVKISSKNLPRKEEKHDEASGKAQDKDKKPKKTKEPDNRTTAAKTYDRIAGNNP